MAEYESQSRDNDFHVCVRCRPLNQREVETGALNIVGTETDTRKIIIKDAYVVDDVTNDGGDDVRAGADIKAEKLFTFSGPVLGPSSTQGDVYTEVKSVVNAVLHGYDGAVVAYGQTGSGKRHTMLGNEEQPGLIPRAIKHIFQHISESESNKKFHVHVSVFYIYNETIIDCLSQDQNKQLQIKERPGTGVYIQDLAEVTVTSMDEAMSCITEAHRKCAIHCTHMGRRIKSGDTMYSITVEQLHVSQDKTCQAFLGKLYLVVFRGSERQSRTSTTEEHLKEASKIGMSLSPLGTVVSALTDPKARHIPYRNSKVTRALQNALGGSCKTLWISHIIPARENYDETLKTLRYALRAERIKNKASVNMEPSSPWLQDMRQQFVEMGQNKDSLEES